MKNIFSVITFDSVKARLCWLNHVSLVENRRMNNNLTLKGHLENLTQDQGHDLAGKGHVSYQCICNIGLNTSMYGAFMALSSFYQKLLPKNCW